MFDQAVRDKGSILLGYIFLLLLWAISYYLKAVNRVGNSLLMSWRNIINISVVDASASKYASRHYLCP